MKKLTAGILTVMLGIVSANSADAAVASKLYVDSKADAAAAAAQSAAESTAASELADAKSELEGKINTKVAQSDYNTKIGELENADTNLQGQIDALTGTEGVAKQIADAVKVEEDARKLADQGLQASIDAINNGDTGILKSAKDYTDQKVAADVSELGTEVSDILGEGFSKESTVASQLGAVKATADGAVQDVTTGTTNGTINVDGTDVPVQGLGSAAYTSADAYDLKGSASAVRQAFEEFQSGPVSLINTRLDTLEGDVSAAGSVAYAVNAGKIQAIAEAKSDAASQISNLNLNELSRVPAECGVAGKYCVLTSDGTNYLWEVIERAADEVQETGTPIPSVIQNPADK